MKWKVRDPVPGVRSSYCPHRWVVGGGMGRRTGPARPSSPVLWLLQRAPYPGGTGPVPQTARLAPPQGTEGRTRGAGSAGVPLQREGLGLCAPVPSP